MSRGLPQMKFLTLQYSGSPTRSTLCSVSRSPPVIHIDLDDAVAGRGPGTSQFPVDAHTEGPHSVRIVGARDDAQRGGELGVLALQGVFRPAVQSVSRQPAATCEAVGIVTSVQAERSRLQLLGAFLGNHRRQQPGGGPRGRGAAGGGRCCGWRLLGCAGKRPGGPDGFGCTVFGRGGVVVLRAQPHAERQDDHSGEEGTQHRRPPTARAACGLGCRGLVRSPTGSPGPPGRGCRAGGACSHRPARKAAHAYRRGLGAAPGDSGPGRHPAL